MNFAKEITWIDSNDKQQNFPNYKNKKGFDNAGLVLDEKDYKNPTSLKCESDTEPKMQDCDCDNSNVPSETKTNIIKSEGQYERKCCTRFFGMFLMTLSSLFFSLAVAMVKFLGKYQVLSIVAWRFIGGCVLPCIPVLIFYQFVRQSSPFQTVYPRKENVKRIAFLFLRVVIGVGALNFRYNAIKYISLADTAAVAFSTPIFVTFLARLLLGERFGVMNIIAALTALLGIGIITRPPFITGEREFDTTVMIGVSLALGAMLFGTFVFLLLRVLKHVHFAVITLSFGIFGTIICIILAETFGGMEWPSSTRDWLVALAMCAFTFVAQVCITVAFKYEEAGPLSMFRSFDVVFSFIWQLIFFSVIPDIYSVAGSFFIVFGVILIGFRKFLHSLPDDNILRKICCIVLK